jgi:adenylylsulfate kinase-like enzyme
MAAPAIAAPLDTKAMHTSNVPTPLLPVFGEAVSPAEAQLDHANHGWYTKQRQQDVHVPVLAALIKDRPADEEGEEKKNKRPPPPSRPTVVFMAGSMASGHTHVWNCFLQLLPDEFCALNFLRNDPDVFKTQLPEAAQFASDNDRTASTRLHHESCYLSERLLWEALARGRNMVVEGTLKDEAWHRDWFERIRLLYPAYRIVILYVEAPRETILQRAERRAKRTGRFVPPSVLEDAIRRVPESVAGLTPRVDLVLRIDNGKDQPEGRMDDQQKASWADVAQKLLDVGTACTKRLALFDLDDTLTCPNLLDTPFEEALAALQRVNQANAQVAIVSYNREASKILSRAGLRSHVAFVSGLRCGNDKCANLHEVMSHFPEVLKSEMVYFDDDPNHVAWMRLHGIDDAFLVDSRTGITVQDVTRAGF